MSLAPERSRSTAGGPAAPVPTDERAAVLDVLRGLALFGILVANLHAMSLWGATGALDPRTLPTAALDPAADFLQVALVEGKFYSIFSLLFGIGFAIQLQRAAERGDGTGRYVRRLLVLLGVGVAHLLFVYTGDILALYALVGLLLVPLRRLSDRAVLLVAAALLLVPVARYALYWRGGIGVADPLWALADGYAASQVPERLSRYEVWASGDWRLFFLERRVGALFRAADLVEQMRPAKVLSMFLVGLWVGRRRLYARLDEARPLLRRVAFVGLGAGLPANVLMAWLDARDVMYGGPPDFAGSALGLVQTLTYAVGVAPLALGYAALAGLAWTHPARRRMLGWLAPAGRMALTNYLLQSLVMIGLFFGAGLGLAGRLGPTILWGIALAVVALQSAASAAWLARFRFGPAEWLWRVLTYGRWQPMRRATPEPMPHVVAL